MANLLKYQSKAAYQSATNRESNENNVSLIGSNNNGEILCDGCNVIVPFDGANVEIGDYLIFDKIDNCKKLVKAKTLIASELDGSRYVIPNIVCSQVVNKVAKFTYADFEVSQQAGADNEYMLVLDLSHSGGFTYSASPQETAKTATVSWEAGATLASVLSQCTATGNGLTITSYTGTSSSPVTAIVFVCHGYSSNTLTISGQTGVTVTDCSMTTRVGVNGTEMNSHKDYQCLSFNSNFPEISFPAPLTEIVQRNGGVTYYAGANLSRFVEYFSTNGSATIDLGLTAKMKKSVFDSCASGTDEQKAFYESFSGDYTKYMAGRMYDPSPRVKRGMNYIHYNDEKSMTDTLASLVFTSYDGTIKPCYPAAYAAHNKGVVTDGYVTGFEPGSASLPSIDNLAAILLDVNLASINASIVKISGGRQYSRTGYYWSCTECYRNSSWLHNGGAGYAANGYRMNSYSVRASLAFEI